jgi:hypothetical protein
VLSGTPWTQPILSLDARTGISPAPRKLSRSSFCPFGLGQRDAAVRAQDTPHFPRTSALETRRQARIHPPPRPRPRPRPRLAPPARSRLPCPIDAAGHLHLSCSEHAVRNVSGGLGDTHPHPTAPTRTRTRTRTCRHHGLVCIAHGAPGIQPGCRHAGRIRPGRRLQAALQRQSVAGQPAAHGQIFAHEPVPDLALQPPGRAE